MNESAKPRFLLILSLLLGLALAACTSQPAEPPLKGARIGGPFSLVNQDGRPVTEKDFLGKYRIVYFGFAHCPDICPTDLAAVGQALRRFEKSDPDRAARVQPIFVTVDPERDRPAVVKEYVAAFHPRLVGLTGTVDQVKAAAKSHAVYFSKTEAKPDGSYGMDHSRVLLLMDPRGDPVALLPQDKGVEGIAAELERWVR